MKRSPRLLLLLALIPLGSSAESNPYLIQLQQEAMDRKLANEPQWQVLGHYQKKLWRTESLIDDPAFFISPNGKTNPEAELLATLSAFFQSADTGVTNHPVCAYPARFDWLCQELDIDKTLLPIEACPSVEEVYEFLQPSQLTLVFPSAYMNSPASMFGHTLLVFDRPDENRLLARSVSYAARTDESVGPLFAFYGIFGMYPGYFAVEPYYDKVEQYNDINRRDIWEYRLNFTPEEVRTIFLHTWELQNTYARYFFFTENCAYMLYSFYDVARPELNLRSEKGLYVIPMDTVKQVMERGLVVDTAYRPSKVSRVRQLRDRLNRSQQKDVLNLAQGKQSIEEWMASAPDPDAQKITLDTAAMLTQIYFTEGSLAKEMYTPRYFQLLKARSKLGPPDADAPPFALPRRPDEGHPPALLALGAGWDRSEPYYGIRLRPSYHELMDNDIGFDRGAEILFLNTEIRTYPEQNRVRLERLDLVTVESLAPRDVFFQPFSWKVKTGMMQHPRRPNESAPVGYINTGSGMAWDRQWIPGLSFLMAEGRAQVGSTHPDSYAAGGGLSIGWMASFTPTWKILARGRVHWMFMGETYEDHEASIGTDLRFTDRWSLRLEGAYRLRDGYEQPDARIWINRFF